MPHSLALFPWIEANQGFLTLLALVLALVAFIVENRRANEAELHSRGVARRQEALDRDRALEFEAKEAARTRDNQNLRLTEFVSSVVALIDMADGSIGDEITLTTQSPWFRPSASMVELCSGIANSLTALLPAAPLDPQLILLTQQAASVSVMTAKMGFGDTISANQTVVLARDALRDIRAKLEARLDALLVR